MHIYSSPRNMSVNLGSVSTKHEQHLLPNRLYLQQIWHCAHSFCSLLYFLPSSSSISLLIFFFSFFDFILFIIDRRLEIFHRTICHVSVTISELLNYSSALKQTLVHCTSSEWSSYVSVCVCMCVMVLVAPLGSGGSVKTQRDQLQGRTSIPLGVVTSLLRVSVRVSCTRSEWLRDMKTKIL